MEWHIASQFFMEYLNTFIKDWLYPLNIYIPHEHYDLNPTLVGH
jgi:hypothetical protein